MFWKKRKDNIIDFTFKTDDKRSAFRVNPPEDFYPVVIMESKDAEKRELPIKDISTGGISFSQENLKAGETHRVWMRMPHEPNEIFVKFEILSVDEQHVCHCRFMDLDEKKINKIYRYVLEVQKRDLR